MGAGKYKAVSSKKRSVSLQDIITAAVQCGKASIAITGDCMEALDIMDGGRVDVDLRHFPRIGDPCVCYASAPSDGADSVMCKQYDGVWMGHMVGTRYKWEGGKGRMNYGFPAVAILGVVYASYAPDGRLLWQTDPDSYPVELPTRSTVTRGNVGQPMEVVKV